MNKGKDREYIRTLARSDNITAAADELGVSQPALSISLKKVEDDLGVKLFDRSRGNLSITDAGRAYLDYLDETEEIDRTLRKRISDIECLRQGRVVLGGASSFNIAYAPSCVAAYAIEYPGIDVEVVNGTVPEIEAAALAGAIDVFMTPFPHDEENFEYCKLVSERMFICVPSSWQVNEELPGPGETGFAMLGSSDLAKLDGLDFVMLHESQQMGARFRKLLSEYGVKPGKVVVTDQAFTALALTLQGVGISLVSDGTLLHGNVAKAPAVYFLDCGYCLRDLFVAIPKHKYVSNAARKLVETMVRVVGGGDEGGARP